MEKGKKQKNNAASVPPPTKKIKKVQKKKAKVPITTVKQDDVKSVAAENKEDSAKQVAGYIFFCNGKTKAECYQSHVFGLPRGKLEDVQKIKKGAKLFLFDYELKLLYGVYKAGSDGGLNLEAGAFNGNFPAQVKFKVLKDCYPLPETALKHVIKANYNNRGRFNPELSSDQVKTLMSLFQPISNKLQSTMSQAVDERRAAPLPPTERAHATRAPILLDAGFASAARLPPLSGAYHSVAAGMPPNDLYRPTAASGHQTGHRAYFPQTSHLLERYRAVPHVMLPNEPPPVPARDYRYINARDNEVATRMELANEYYAAGRAGELPPPQIGWAPEYESMNRVYADDHLRAVSGRANASNVPVTSLYSFAGAAPAYR